MVQNRCSRFARRLLVISALAALPVSGAWADSERRLPPDYERLYKRCVEEAADAHQSCLMPLVLQERYCSSLPEGFERDICYEDLVCAVGECDRILEEDVARCVQRYFAPQFRRPKSVLEELLKDDGTAPAPEASPAPEPPLPPSRSVLKKAPA